MKIVMISGNGGSGGLIGYIKGLLSFHYNPEEVEVVLFCGRNLAKKLETVKTPVRIIGTKHAAEKGIDIVLNRPLHPKLIEKIKYEEPDVVFFLNGYIRKGLEMYPNLMTLHNQLYIDFFQLARHGFSKIALSLIAFRFAVTRSMRKADGVIFLSEFSKNQTDQKRIHYNNGIVIPFGFEKENRTTDIRVLSSNKKIKLIYISAIFPYKNHLNLLKAISELKSEGYNIELYLVGQKVKPYYKKIEKAIATLDLKKEVILHDWVDHERIKHLIDISDIFIYASSTETTGYGLLEGMARGALIASSNQAGFPSMLKDGGVYFEPKNIESIKKAIEYLIGLSSEERIKLRENALEYSSEYSWEKAAQQHYEYFSSIKYKR